jgi:hypothetical protein
MIEIFVRSFAPRFSQRRHADVMNTWKLAVRVRVQESETSFVLCLGLVHFLQYFLCSTVLSPCPFTKL